MLYTDAGYQLLKGEIARPEYGGMSDAEIAQALNAIVIPHHRKIPTFEARGVLLATGEWGKIALLADGRLPLPADMPPQQRAELEGLAITVRDTLTTTQEIDTDEAPRRDAVIAMLAMLVQAGLVSTETQDVLLSLTDTLLSRTEELGLGRVEACDVQTARLVP